MSYNEVGGVFGDNEPEKVEITCSKVDDTFLDKFDKFLERAESRRERYDLTWNGKAASFAEAGKPLEPAKTLRPDLDESVDFDKTQNLFITGDNLEALKLLQESYLNKIDMIYIDPPYNTGHDFVYHDNFHRKQSDEIDDSRDDDDNRQYVVNSKENGRYHSDWLSMMYPRLMIARNLLSENGVIFISIDDSEQANLKLMCDEVFGADSFAGQIVWLKKNAQNDAESMQRNHEYLVCYKKEGCVLESKNDVRKIVQKDSTGKWFYKGAGLTTGGAGGTLNNRPMLGYSIYVNDTTGDKVAVRDYNVNLARVSNNESEIYHDRKDLIDAGYRIVRPPRKGAGLGCWTWALDKFNREKENVIISGNSVCKKVYVNSSEVKCDDGAYYVDIVTSRPYNSFYIDDTPSSLGVSEMSSLMGTKVFDHPKSTKLLKKLMGQFANSTILDFFAGSGTTADAVMQLNAEDGGHRKFIMVQLPEDCNKKSEAYKAGYKTIDQLSRERISRAAKKIKESDKNADDHDYGFRALYIDKANAKDDISVSADSLQQSQLSFQVDDIYADRSPLDLLFGALVAKGWQLDGKIEHRNVDGNDVYLYDYVSGAGMVTCFDNELTDKAINQIIDMHPQVAVFRETAFKQSDEKINLMERFKNDSPETRVWVI